MSMSQELNEMESSTQSSSLSKLAEMKLQEEAWLEASRRAIPKSQINERYLAFQKRYRNRADLFVLECFEWKEGEGPTSYQLDILKGVSNNPRQSVRGPHGLGKTALAAWLVHWYALTRDGEDWKVVTTASVWRQLTKFLWPEIHKWSRRLKWSIIGRKPYNLKYELQTLQLKLRTGAAFAVASDDHTAIEGAHADCLLYMFDESKSVIDATFDAAEGAFSGAGEGSDVEAFALAISTPGEPLGRFFDIHSRKAGFEDWKAIHVTVEQAIAAGRVTEEWVEQRKKQWGEASTLFKNRVLGEFSSSDEDGVIPLEWIEAANRRWHDWKDKGVQGILTAVGADIGSGAEGSNLTVIAKVYDHCKIDKLDKYGRGSVDFATMETANRISGILETSSIEGYVDVCGIGIGVYHRLRELKYKNAYPFNSAQKTKRRDQNDEFGFINKRAAGWWLLRETLSPDSDVKLCLPPDDDLIGELATPKYQIMAGGNLKIESKDDIMKRIGRSTDSADAVIYALTGPILAKLPQTLVYFIGEGLDE